MSDPTDSTAPPERPVPETPDETAASSPGREASAPAPASESASEVPGAAPETPHATDAGDAGAELQAEEPNAAEAAMTDAGSAGSDAAPETASDATSEAEPDAEPDAATETAPDATSEAEPDAATDAAPETPSDASAATAKSQPKPKPKDPTIFRAFRARRPVQGKILGVVKGGYEVQVGRAKAFCPHSQLDLKRIDDAEAQVGKTYEFRIAQLRRAGDDIVLSRRLLLEAELEEQASAVRASLLEGAEIQGKVSGLADFGAFVDLGAGVTGLVHLTELGWGRYAKPADAVSVGDVVQVKILKIRDDGKISLSIKQATTDPWSGVAERYSEGAELDVKLLRFADFGVFVELEPGVEGLAPAREMPPRAGGWRDGLELGTTVPMRIIRVEPKRRRVSLVPRFEGMERYAEAPAAGQTRPAIVQKVETFGVFLWLSPGAVGLMPNVLSGEPRGTDMEEKFPVGAEIEVEVVDVEQGGRRIRLAKPGQAERQREIDEKRKRFREEKLAAREAAQSAADDATAFGSSLGDKLRAALDGDKGR